MTGRLPSGEVATVPITPERSPAANPAFDVTPARLVTGLLTERGCAEASEEGLLKLFPEMQQVGED
jgi:methylthioribose-1-phosphate isomerase